MVFLRSGRERAPRWARWSRWWSSRAGAAAAGAATRLGWRANRCGCPACPTPCSCRTVTRRARSTPQPPAAARPGRAPAFYFGARFKSNSLFREPYQGQDTTPSIPRQHARAALQHSILARGFNQIHSLESQIRDRTLVPAFRQHARAALQFQIAFRSCFQYPWSQIWRKPIIAPVLDSVSSASFCSIQPAHRQRYPEVTIAAGLAWP